MNPIAKRIILLVVFSPFWAPAVFFFGTTIASTPFHMMHYYPTLLVAEILTALACLLLFSILCWLVFRNVLRPQAL